jgi:hypothetical protein
METSVEAVIFASDASVPVTVKVYVPADVAGVPGAAGDAELAPPPPPQPIAPAAPTTTIKTSDEIQRRRRDGLPNRSMPARTTPPLPSPHGFICDGRVIATVLAPVVFAVNTAFVVPPDVIATLIGFKLHVGKLCAPEGLRWSRLFGQFLLFLKWKFLFSV